MKIKEILEKHKKWLNGEGGGERADLRGANLRGAKNTDRVIWNIYTAFYPLQCPEKGAYTAFKKARDLIVELEIPADAMRSSATSRKCRASKARVISITDVDGNPGGDSVASDYDSNFVYRVGEMVEVPDFNTDRWNECAPGIHHFITRGEAVRYEWHQARPPGRPRSGEAADGGGGAVAVSVVRNPSAEAQT